MWRASGAATILVMLVGSASLDGGVGAVEGKSGKQAGVWAGAWWFLGLAVPD